jgi:hypothetical protein
MNWSKWEKKSQKIYKKIKQLWVYLMKYEYYI